MRWFFYFLFFLLLKISCQLAESRQPHRKMGIAHIGQQTIGADTKISSQYTNFPPAAVKLTDKKFSASVISVKPSQVRQIRRIRFSSSTSPPLMALAVKIVGGTKKISAKNINSQYAAPLGEGINPNPAQIANNTPQAMYNFCLVMAIPPFSSIIIPRLQKATILCKKGQPFGCPLAF